MPRRIRSLALCVTLAALLLVGGSPRGTSISPADSLATARPEVRLRKLHLVRPDLIPYPIYYEVCC